MTPLYPIGQPLPSTSGIYRITCTITKKFYIGSAVNLRNRWQDHRKMLRRNAHKNPKLQAAWNKYSEESFAFEIVELVLVPFLLEREQHWLDTLNPFGKKGFNIALIAGSNLGMKHSPQARANNSAAQLGKKLSEETRHKMSESRKGKKHSPELREKIRLAALARPPMSPETRAKIGNASGSRTHTTEAIEKMRQALKGRSVSDETCAKISAKKTGQTRILIAVSPDGVEHTVYNVSKFCREHALSRNTLVKVANGKHAQTKGWRAHFSESATS